MHTHCRCNWSRHRRRCYACGNNAPLSAGCASNDSKPIPSCNRSAALGSLRHMHAATLHVHIQRTSACSHAPAAYISVHSAADSATQGQQHSKTCLQSVMRSRKKQCQPSTASNVNHQPLAGAPGHTYHGLSGRAWGAASTTATRVSVSKCGRLLRGMGRVHRRRQSHTSAACC